MMHHRFFVNASTGQNIPVRLKVNPRAKRIILRLDPKLGEAVVTVPKEKDFKAAERFVSTRVHWLETQLRKIPLMTEIAPGGTVPLRGLSHRLLRSGDKGVTKIIDGDDDPAIDSPGAELTFADRIIRYLKMEARRDLTAAVDRHAANLGAQPGKISIRDTKSRWGSCSSKGHLNFSWRLILAPPEVLDYVAAHEVSHLIEMNHSAAFWAQVEKTYGPYKEASGWLKRHGAELHAVG